MSIYTDTPADLRIDRETREALRLGPPGRRWQELQPERQDPIMDAQINYSRPPMFGDDNQQDQHDRAFVVATASATAPFTVAPRCSLDTPRGTLHEGQAVELADVGGNQAVMASLVSERVIIALTQSEVEARRPPVGDRQRYRVASGRKSLGAARGRTLLPDAPCCAEDFQRPVQLDADGLPIAGQPSGEQILARLVKAGLVVDVQAGEQPQQRAAGARRR